ncbi:MAG: hypothetical protein K6E91_13730 [Butyrivibrio sp.]|nr:hypothetical protein [Butyrivibrio sp.]
MMRQFFVIYDENRVYCERLCEYLRNNLKLSFEICAFTRSLSLLEFSEKNEISLLIMSQSGANELINEKTKPMWKNIVILGENGQEEISCDSETQSENNILHICKYLPASEILKKVLGFIYKRAEDFSGIGIMGEKSDCSIIGFYTPISRSGQTTLAVRMGEKLSRKGKSIVLSLESYSAIGSMFPDEAPDDITDLLYYLDCENDRFCIYLEKIKRTRNGLDFVVPAKTAMQIKEISYDRLKELITHLSEDAGYEYILLDLKDYPDGFYDILSMCDVVYTINRNNSADHYRIGRFNIALSENGYDRVIAKTVKFLLPDNRNPKNYDRFVDALISEGLEVKSLGA